MAEGTNVVEEPNSCKISVNAKGLFSGEVKVYAEHIDVAISLAFLKAEDLEKLIQKKNSLAKPEVK